MDVPGGGRLGAYEIGELLGEGGMGRVFRGRDTRLGRTVAIKVLHPDVASDPTHRARFEREAKAVAELTHPNICTLHDVGEQDGQAFLVMELLQGETLAAALKRRGAGLPADEAADIAAQVATALAFAHRRRVVHRDVKPSNIMLTPTGVKLLDFGLARPWEAEGTGDQTTQAVLTTSRAAVGTLPYMAPEQIDGKSDARTDIFALGAVLFEMLTGRRAFDAESTAGILAAVVKTDPPSLTSLRPDLPPALSRLVSRCLAKDPDRRWQSAADLADELKWIASHGADAAGGATTPTALTRSRVPAWIWAACLALASALGVAGYSLGRSNATPAAPFTFDLELPPGTTGTGAGLALSPDGQWIALVTQTAGIVDPRLWVRALGAPTGWRLVSGAGNELPLYPFWSPDGRSLAFFVNTIGGSKGTLMRVDAPAFNQPVPVCTYDTGALGARGGAWFDDGTIVFAPTPESGLWKCPAAGGASVIFLDSPSTGVFLKYPAAVGRRGLLYWLQPAQIPAKAPEEVRLTTLDNPSQSTLVVQSGASATYDRGTLFYSLGGVLVGQRLDARSGTLAGSPSPIPVDVLQEAPTVGGPSATAAAGHVALRNRRASMSRLVWVDRVGTSGAQIGEEGIFNDPDIDLTGTRLAVGRETPGEPPSIRVMDLTSSGSARRVVSGPGATAPLWAPDGRRLMFRMGGGSGGNPNLYQLEVDRLDSVQPLLAERSAGVHPAGWLADDVIVWMQSSSGRAGLFSKTLKGPESELARVETRDGVARVSADGEYVARLCGVASDLCLNKFSEVRDRPLVIASRAATPRWSSDSRELFYISDGQLWSVTMPADGSLSPGTPAKVFSLPAAPAPVTSFAVHPDGKRFILVLPVTPSVATVKVTLNWQPGR